MSFLTSRQSHAQHGIEKSVPRREGARVLTDAGQYAGANAQAIRTPRGVDMLAGLRVRCIP